MEKKSLIQILLTFLLICNNAAGMNVEFECPHCENIYNSERGCKTHVSRYCLGNPSSYKRIKIEKMEEKRAQKNLRKGIKKKIQQEKKYRAFCKRKKGNRINRKFPSFIFTTKESQNQQLISPNDICKIYNSQIKKLPTFILDSQIPSTLTSFPTKKSDYSQERLRNAGSSRRLPPIPYHKKLPEKFSLSAFVDGRLIVYK